MTICNSGSIFGASESGDRAVSPAFHLKLLILWAYNPSGEPPEFLSKDRGEPEYPHQSFVVL
jgi:hypothetical protein